MAGTVTVASKLPFPLVLQLEESYGITEEVFGGGVREKVRWRKVGERVVINGCAIPMDRPTEKQIVGGAAFTHGVDAEFFAKWMEQKRNFAPVVNGLIFAAAKPADVVAEAKDLKDLKSGFEPVDPENLPDEFKAVEKDKAAA